MVRFGEKFEMKRQGPAAIQRSKNVKKFSLRRGFKSIQKKTIADSCQKVLFTSWIQQDLFFLVIGDSDLRPQKTPQLLLSFVEEFISWIQFCGWIPTLPAAKCRRTIKQPQKVRFASDSSNLSIHKIDQPLNCANTCASPEKGQKVQFTS
jgi:hypothetical protein